MVFSFFAFQDVSAVHAVFPAKHANAQPSSDKMLDGIDQDMRVRPSSERDAILGHVAS